MSTFPLTFYIWTAGCQMNKADSGRFAAAMEAAGLVPVETIQEAGVIILNTCSVRRSAEQRAQSKLGSLKAIKRSRPETIVILAGCMVSGDTQAMHRQYPLADAFIPAGDVEALLEAVSLHTGGAIDASACQTGQLLPRLDGPSAWVPIIYGCNQFCSYCIVPYRRGRERSRPVNEIAAEVERMVQAGALEVTLLGQNVDAYGRDLKDTTDLAALLEAVDAVPGLRRVRFLTSHPRYMTARLIEAVGRLPKVCEHINLPVQSGDDDVLRAMGRGYTNRQYRDLVASIRKAVPGVSLSTDLIVGFPGEAEEQFLSSYHLLQELEFDVVHAAMYSPRPGTAAAKLADDVPPEEKKRRLQKVEELQEQIAARLNARLVGARVEVLVEAKKGGKWFGRTRTNKLVFFSAPGHFTGWIGEVEIVSGTAWSLQGQLPGFNVMNNKDDRSGREACRE